jgi:hypothetical protein
MCSFSEELSAMSEELSGELTVCTRKKVNNYSNALICVYIPNNSSVDSKFLCFSTSAMLKISHNQAQQGFLSALASMIVYQLSNKFTSHRSNIWNELKLIR